MFYMSIPNKFLRTVKNFFRASKNDFRAGRCWLWMPFLPYAQKYISVDWIWIWLLRYLTVIDKSVQFGNIAKKLINIGFCRFIFLIERKHYSY